MATQIAFTWESVPAPVLAANPNFKYCFKLGTPLSSNDEAKVYIGQICLDLNGTGIVNTFTNPCTISIIVYTDPGGNFYFSNATGRTIYGLFFKDNNNVLLELIPEEGFGETNYLEVPDPEPTPTEEQAAINCFTNQVQEKIQEFTTDVSNFVKRLNYGSFCCKELNQLILDKKALQLLTCYDTRDIYNCTEQDYELSEENRRYLSYIGLTGGKHAGYVGLSSTSSAAINELYISSTPYNEPFTSGTNSWVNTNFAKWDVIRISEESTLDTNNINAGLYLIYLNPTDYITYIKYYVLSLSDLDVTGTINIDPSFNFTDNSEFLRISKGGTGTTFGRKTSVSTTNGTFYVGPTIATTTFTTTTTITINSNDAEWNYSFVVGDFVVLFADGGTNLGEYRITSTTGTTDTKIVLGTAFIASAGTFVNTVDKQWAIIRVSSGLSSTTIPSVCTQDTTDYNNFTYTEMKNLLNS